MGKATTTKRNSASASKPYDRKSAKATKNNIFKFNKDYGQHILKNPGISKAIVEKASLKPTDTVLEVGPGSGNLTVNILPACKKLICVEIDPRMAAEVTKRFQGIPEHRKLEVLIGDVIGMPVLPSFDVLISNTPYQISSPLVFKILGMPKPPRCAVLMLQREFAQRLVAHPGEKTYCRLSVNAQLFSKISHVLNVGKANFNPPPEVESSVVRIEPYWPRPNVCYEEWDGLLRIVFLRPNKTMRASFTNNKIMAMLERNYRTYASLSNLPLDDTIVTISDNVEMDTDNNDASDDAMDEDDVPDFFREMQIGSEAKKDAKTPGSRGKNKVFELVKNKVLGVLERTELGAARPIKCDQSRFLRLLYEFNKEGIHFSS